jgi:hypothetical protein
MHAELPEKEKLIQRYWQLEHACTWGRHDAAEWRRLYDEKMRIAGEVDRVDATGFNCCDPPLIRLQISPTSERPA